MLLIAYYRLGMKIPSHRFTLLFKYEPSLFLNRHGGRECRLAPSSVRTVAKRSAAEDKQDAYTTFCDTTFCVAPAVVQRSIGFQPVSERSFAPCGPFDIRPVPYPSSPTRPRPRPRPR